MNPLADISEMDAPKPPFCGDLATF